MVVSSAVRPTTYRPDKFAGGRANPIYDPAALMIFAAFPTAPTLTEKNNINICVLAFKAAGVWTKFSLLYVLGATGSPSDNGLINWANPGTFNLSVGAAGGTFTAYRGYAGNGTSSYLDTTWDASNNGGSVFQQNDAHVGGYVLTAGNSTTQFGTQTANTIGIRADATTGLVRVNFATAHTLLTTVVPPKHVVGVRRESTTVYGFQDGSPDGSTLSTSAARSSSDLAIGKYNTVGFSTSQVFAAHCGTALTDAEVLAIYNALHTLAVAVGADT